MRGWTRLTGWAEEERASATIYMRLSQDAEWCAQGQGGLWSDPELALGLRWREENHPTAAWAQRYNALFAQSMDFLSRSEQERTASTERENERKKKLRNTQWAAGILGVLALVAVVLALVALKKSATRRIVFRWQRMRWMSAFIGRSRASTCRGGLTPDGRVPERVAG